MTDQQFKHYQAISDDYKYILNVAALMGSRIDISDLSALVQNRIKVTQKQVKNCMDEAVIAKLFKLTENYYGSRSEYEVSLPVAIFLYPGLGGLSKEWKKAREYYSNYYDSKNQILQYSELLYYLLHDEKKYQEKEQFLLRYQNMYANASIPDLSDILLYEVYEKVLPRMSEDLLTPIIYQLEERFYRSLQPLELMESHVERLSQRLPESHKYAFSDWPNRMAFLGGKLDKFLELSTQISVYEYPYRRGTEALFEGKVDEALTFFERGLKQERSLLKGLILPQKPEFSLYYLLALSCSKPEKSASAFQKQIKALAKKNNFAGDIMMTAVAAYCLDDKSAKQITSNYTRIYLDDFNQSLIGLLAISILYLSDQKPDNVQLKRFQTTIQIGYENGYGLLAYEAAYALTRWDRSEHVTQLYQRIAASFQHQPGLSILQKQEPWEQVLNSFLTFGKIQKGGKSTETDTAKHRILYFVNQEWNRVQPVLQTRTTKGWTKGRNIGLKTFGENGVEGMTDQDVRIAKHVKRYDSGWGAPSYQFNESVIKDLVSHPLLFLEGTVPIPVELLPAQPILTVKKEANGYTLNTNIKDAFSRYYIEKETNTRYHFYEMTNEMQQLLQRVLQQSIVIPEQGKSKLIQALSVFSATMQVQSDLLADDRSQVRTVPSDARTRVQLLPFGSGLKAELFTKPFGDIPPYCKPGKGGANLFANQQNEQRQTSRNLALEIQHANVLLDEIQGLESVGMTNELITFEQPEGALELLEILAKHPDTSVVEWPEGVRFRLRATAATQQLQLRIKSKTNWFELDGELQIDENTVLTLLQLMELTALSQNRFIELQSGEFISLSKQLRKQLEDLRNFSHKAKDSLHLNPYAAVALGEEFDREMKIKADKTWREFQRNVQSSKDLLAEIPTNLQADLRSYQEEGFQWMARLAAWNAGACLADDMGLGKTIQALAILLQRASLGPAVVICPVSVLPNWLNEVERFAPSLQVKTLGMGDRSSTFQSLQAGDLLILSYGLLQSEVQTMGEIEFSTAVLDEAHTIKNVTTKTSQAAMKLKADFRVALTGTPIQNHLGEIWNLFNFINPGLLGSLNQFNERFVKADDAQTRKQLKRLISPFLLRRTKAAVLDELPPKTEILLKIPLSTDERAFYEALRRKAIATLETDDGKAGTRHLQALAEITRLRQACCHPSLVDSSLHLDSSKLSALMELVAELKENNHRALVFSQFVGHLSLVRKALDQQQISYLYLDGSTPMKERGDLVSRFQQGSHDLFLISLKAGGLGLNLTAADYIIHLDPWWNPAIEDQASDRAHRIGQSRPVTVYRLVAEDTIEEKILKLHLTKRDLADTLLEGSDKAGKLTLKELMAILGDVGV